MHPYQQQKEEVLRELHTSQESGLAGSEVVRRQVEYGPNKINTASQKTLLNFITEQVVNVLTILLIVAAVISVLSGQGVDAIVILAAVIVNVTIGTIQEYRADRDLRSLQQASDLETVVIRDGKRNKISAEDLVLGDIVVLAQGEKIPADMRLLEEQHLKVNEAILTGESSAVAKMTDQLPEESAVGDQRNMVFMGTTIMAGSGKAVVVQTGYKTELGGIVESIRSKPEVITPLQQQIKKFTWWVGGAALVIVGIVIIIGIARGMTFTEIIPLSVSLAVAAVPEGLATSVFIVLAFGMRRMLKKKALTQKLVAAETLGSVSVLCVDKTGTITKGVMQMQQLHTTNNVIESVENELAILHKEVPKETHELLQQAVLASDAFCVKKDQKLECVGDETEQAIVRGVVEYQLLEKDLEKKIQRFDVIPFDAETKFMATLYGNTKYRKEENTIAMKGAPEVVLEFCTGVFEDHGVRDLNSARKEKWLKLTDKLSRQGLRTLAVASRRIHPSTTSLDESQLSAMTFIGIIAFEDPVREGALQTVQLARRAGVRTMIVTGDHKEIAINIADQIGLNTSPKAVMVGDELQKLSNSELRARINDISVVARISPRDKMRIIETLQARGHAVGMTGDGVNDAPALHGADIGIAVASGTDAAKEAADMVLLDNNIQTIVDAVREGRRIYSNIKKIIRYLISDSFSEITIILFALAIGVPAPLTAIHILWINIASDGFIGIALAQEPEEKKNMQVPPRKRDEPIIDTYTKTVIAIVTVVSAAASFGLYWWTYKTTNDLILARTMAFTLLATDSIFYVLSIRASTESIFRVNPFKNKWLNIAIVVTFGLQLAALYIPPLSRVLGTEPLSLREWEIIGAIIILTIVTIESAKMFSLAVIQSKLRNSPAKDFS